MPDACLVNNNAFDAEALRRCVPDNQLQLDLPMTAAAAAVARITQLRHKPGIRLPDEPVITGYLCDDVPPDFFPPPRITAAAYSLAAFRYIATHRFASRATFATSLPALVTFTLIVMPGFIRHTVLLPFLVPRTLDSGMWFGCQGLS